MATETEKKKTYKIKTHKPNQNIGNRANGLNRISVKLGETASPSTSTRKKYSEIKKRKVITYIFYGRLIKRDFVSLSTMLSSSLGVVNPKQIWFN